MTQEQDNASTCCNQKQHQRWHYCKMIKAFKNVRVSVDMRVFCAAKPPFNAVISLLHLPQGRGCSTEGWLYVVLIPLCVHW